jgi:hypothetical protein
MATDLATLHMNEFQREARLHFETVTPDEVARRWRRAEETERRARSARCGGGAAKTQSWD